MGRSQQVSNWFSQGEVNDAMFSLTRPIHPHEEKKYPSSEIDRLFPFVLK